MPRMSVVGKTATRITHVNGETHVKYHSTTVVAFNKDTINLCTGGWFTRTTKVRMNQASNQFDLGYYVYQKDGTWYVNYQGKHIPFNNNTGSITLERNTTPSLNDALLKEVLA